MALYSEMDLLCPCMEGQEIISQLSSQSKKPISKLTLKEIQKSVLDTKVDPEAVLKIISSTTIAMSLKERKSYGSSGFDEQKRMISDRIEKINIFRSEVTKRENKIIFAINELQKQIDDIVQ